MSLAKFEGKDLEGKVLAHVAKGEAFPKGAMFFYHLWSLMDNGLHIDDNLLWLILVGCHNLVIKPRWLHLVNNFALGALPQRLCLVVLSFHSMLNAMTPLLVLHAIGGCLKLV